MRFGSVCSGIEAASVAWGPLGFEAAWLSEIEPFPRALLAHHYPTVPNLGDMTTIAARVASGEVEAPDLFCGGTPCQAFSVAGLRNSLDDARGNLSLTFCEIANAVDAARSVRNEPPTIVFWENVPGVLSTKDNAFGGFLAGLAGEDDPLVAPGGKWSNAGCVFGPQRTVAWRVLDAQYFGVAQRRRRVFVVASARTGFDPCEILFEFDGVRRDIAPSRETGESTTHPIAPCLTSSGRGFGRTGDIRGQDPVVAVAYGGNNTGGSIDVAAARNACSSASGRMDFESETVIVQPVAGTLGANHGNIRAEHAWTGQLVAYITGDIAHTLKAEGFDASEDGTGRGTPIVPAIAFQSVDHGADASADLSPTMRRHDPMAVMVGAQVRRLTPTECSRLQGFPDDYTLVPHRNKPAADGPRYKALGNSWAVPNVRWIGERIKAAL